MRSRPPKSFDTFDRQIVPADWLAASFAPAVGVPDGRRYGFRWYLGASNRDDGRGGVRREETVAPWAMAASGSICCCRSISRSAITAGNYDAPDRRRPPVTVLRDVLLPALRT